MDRIDHIGYLTDSIEGSAEALGTFGYQSGAIVNDDVQQTRICFLRKEGEVPIELVQPYEGNKSMLKMLSRRDNGPYHVCYCVDDIGTRFEEMVSEDWIPLFKPVPAPALGNRLICYFFKQEAGFIELVNKQ